MGIQTQAERHRDFKIGKTAERGAAWWYDPALQTDRKNHYEGFVPFEDIYRDLVHWDPVHVPINLDINAISEAGVDSYSVGSNYKAIVRPKGALWAPGYYGEDDPGDPGEVLGIHSQDYAEHSAREIVDYAQSLCGDNVGVSSVLQLFGGRQFGIEISSNEQAVFEGFPFRAQILLRTSLDGSLATAASETVTATVCENTFSAAIGENAEDIVKIKHTKNSNDQVWDSFDSLGAIEAIRERFRSRLDYLMNIEFSGAQFDAFLDQLHPLTDSKGQPIGKTGLTRRQNTRAEYDRLWNSDDRVTPWKNTAFGAVQAHNTFVHWHSVVHAGKGAGEDQVAEARTAKNQAATLAGKWSDVDSQAVKAVEKVLAKA